MDPTTEMQIILGFLSLLTGKKLPMLFSDGTHQKLQTVLNGNSMSQATFATPKGLIHVQRHVVTIPRHEGMTLQEVLDYWGKYPRTKITHIALCPDTLAVINL